MTTHYELLGVRPNAEYEVIKAAFRKALKEHHPDLHPDDAAAELRSKKIIEAYDVLKDPDQRAFYDHSLRHGRVQRRRALMITLLASMGIVSVSSLVFLYLLLAPRHGVATPEIVAAAPKIDMPVVAVVPPVVSTPSSPAPHEAAWASIERTEDMVELWRFVQAYPNTAEGDLSSSRLNRLIDAARNEEELRDIGGLVTGDVAERVQARLAELVASRDITAALPQQEQPALTQTARPPETTEPNAPTEAAVPAAQEARLTPPLDDDLPDATTAPMPEKYDQIIASLDSVISRHPADSQAHLERGIAWLGKGDMDRAMADFDTAITLEDTNIPAFHRRGLLWFRRGEFEKALADLDRAVRLSFADPKVYRDRGMIWFTKNSYDRAIADFDRAIKLAPNIAQFYLERGLAYERKGDSERASANFDEARRRDPALTNILGSRNSVGYANDLPLTATNEAR